MKVILTSEFHRVSDKLLHQGYIDVSKKRVAFVQNATDHRRDAGECVIHRVQVAIDWYIYHGFFVDIIDLRIVSGPDLVETLMGYDYLHVHGGDNKHLLDVARSSGLCECIHDLMAGGLIYIGSSAGSILAGPDLSYSICTSETYIYTPSIQVENFQGLGLHDMYIVPHAGKPTRLPVMLARVQYCEQHQLSPFITLADTQALIYTDGVYTWVGGF